MATPTGQEAVARELDRLCRAIDSFGRDLGDLRTSTAVVVERTERADTEIALLRVRLAAVERRVFVASGAAAAIGILVPYLIQALTA